MIESNKRKSDLKLHKYLKNLGFRIRISKKEQRKVILELKSDESFIEFSFSK
jgi:hypothetical protein